MTRCADLVQENNEQKQTVVVTCLIRNMDAEIILVRHFRRGWELPQGRVHVGETVVEAAHREVLEETGTRVELGALVAVWSKVCDPPATILGFTASYVSGDLTPSEETPEVRWFSPSDALSQVVHLVNRDRLLTLLDHSGGAVHRAYRARPFTLVETAVSVEQIMGTIVPSFSVLS